jgi:hypothetical protein
MVKKKGKEWGLERELMRARPYLLLKRIKK